MDPKVEGILAIAFWGVVILSANRAWPDVAFFQYALQVYVAISAFVTVYVLVTSNQGK